MEIPDFKNIREIPDSQLLKLREGMSACFAKETEPGGKRDKAREYDDALWRLKLEEKRRKREGSS